MSYFLLEVLNRIGTNNAGQLNPMNANGFATKNIQLAIHYSKGNSPPSSITQPKSEEGFAIARAIRDVFYWNHNVVRYIFGSHFARSPLSLDVGSSSFTYRVLFAEAPHSGK